MFLTEVIKDDYKVWEYGSTVVINGPTGCGKSFCMVNKVLPYVLETNREILYLSNRVGVQGQIAHDVCEKYGIPPEYLEEQTVVELAGVTFMTYQALQEKLVTAVDSLNFPFFDYIVCDEAHYIVEDSAFSPKIPRVVKWINSVQCHTKIIISATIEDTLRYLGFYSSGYELCQEQKYLKIYQCPSKDIVRQLKGQKDTLFYYQLDPQFPKMNIFVYQNEEELAESINADKTEDKWLVFLSSKERASKKLMKILKHQNEFVSADDKESEAMRKIIKEGVFEEKVLLTTKVLDNGISIHDRALKNIVIETTSKTEFVQMIGRKRFFDDEARQINLYIQKKSANHFGILLRKNILPALELIDLSEKKILEKILEDEAAYNIVRRLYDYKNGELVLNEIARDQLYAKKKYFAMLERKIKEDSNYFVKYQLGWMNKTEEFDKLIFLSEKIVDNTMKTLIKYLEHMEGIVMEKEEQKKFRKVIKEFLEVLIPKLFPHKNRIPGKSIINEAFNNLEILYEICTKSGKRKGDETQWIVKKK